MKENPKKHTCRALIGLVALTTIVMAANILPAMAQRGTIRVGSEVAVGGLTVAEQAARSLHLHEELMTIIPPGVADALLRIEINQKDRDDLAVTPSGFVPLRVGVVKSVPRNIGKPVGQAFNHGVVEQSTDGSFVWAMTVTSPGAQAIRVHFTEFSLPDNTEMYFLGPNGQAHGPYVGEGRNNNGDFWSHSIRSDTGTVVLKYTGDTPDIDEQKMSFTISDVGHIRGRPPRLQEQSNHDGWPCGDNVPCLVDANCVTVSAVEDAKGAVAKMEWIISPYIYTCTGGLLADTDSGSQIPYFLTANHCFDSSISNLETFFFYTTDSCDGDCPGNVVHGGTPPPVSTLGITVVATGSAGDFTLATLDQDPPADAIFLGWNNSEVYNVDGAPLYRISNANFGPQVYSQHNVTTSSPTCNGLPRGQWIYSEDQTGATMGGSSGSPVLNSAGEVVGQLTGCCGFNCSDECDSANNWTIDGALAHYWNAVSEFLDPLQSGCTGDADCDDGLFCTGTETCVDGSCQSSGDPCPSGTVCNEATDTCDAPACDDDGICESGEDCNNCPNDCRQKTTGRPNSRYCCDGDLPDCGDTRCSESGWSCGDSGGCTSDPECDDSDPCTTDLCTGGVCSNTPIDCDDGDACTADSCSDGVCSNDPISCDDGDPCTTDSCDVVEGCSYVPDPNCTPVCTGAGGSCTEDDDCCSQRCRGRPGNKSCRE